MNFVTEKEREIPLTGNFDVVVCGGGPAGIAAAISAARKGASTALIELHGCLGGIWTAGLLSNILDWQNKGGIIQEITTELKERKAMLFGSIYDAEEMKLLLEEMTTDCGVSVQLFTRVVSALKDGNSNLTHVITESPSGRQAWKGSVFIDATGNGDLAALAGCGFDYGRNRDDEYSDLHGTAQPMSLMGLVTGLKSSKVRQFVLNADSVYEAEGKKKQSPAARENLLEVMKQAGVTPSYTAPTLFQISEHLYALMANQEYGYNAMSSEELTTATINARREVSALVKALASLGGIWRGIRLVSTAEQIGIREGRRIHGLYRITKDDLIEGLSHEDAVCRCTYWVDIHSLDPKVSGSYGNDGITVKPYDIPLRALIARDINGLMMVGRCISGDFFAHASYRVTGNAVAMGEAAGKVAAIAVISEEFPQDVSLNDAGVATSSKAIFCDNL
jgi:hypothetical protein